MDFNIERLKDIVSPYIILMRQSDVVHVSDALAVRMGIQDEDDIPGFLNKDRLFLEPTGNSHNRILLPVKDSTGFVCDYTKTAVNDAELLAFTEVGHPRDTLCEEDASDLMQKTDADAKGAFLIVEQGHIVYASTNLLDKSMRCTSGDLSGRQIISFISEESRVAFIRACGEGLDDPEGMLTSSEIVFVRPSGKRCHVVMDGGWVNHAGKEYLWLEMANITEKIQYERLLNEERQRFSELFDLSPIGLLYISHRGIIIECNNFACKIMRCGNKEIRGLPFAGFVVSPDEEQRLREEFRLLFAEGTGIEKHECQVRTRQGANIAIEYSMQAISRKGRRIKALMVFSDITDKKNLEMELLEKNAETEKTLWEMAEVKDALEARAGELNRVTEELKIVNEKLNQLSITDGLTEIFNHRHFQDRLSEEVSRVNRTENGIVSLLMIDIDDFKQFNDTYGHQCGDMVLKQLAGILRNSVRVIDILARYGGEEFAVILPGETGERAALAAERICESIRSTPFSLGDGISVQVTVSIGVGTLTHGQGDKADLVRKADNALYRAKANLKDRVEIWES